MKHHAKVIVAISALSVSILALGATLASATAPTVTIDPASAISYTSAHLAGKVDPGDQETFYYFQYSADPELEGWNIGAYQGPLAAGSGETAVSDDLTGLKPGTEYFVRLVAENADGQAISAEPNPSFTTDAVVPPTVTIDAPSAVDGDSAQFSGTINPNAPGGNPAAFDVAWRFECTPSCPGELSGQIDADSVTHSVLAQAEGLEPNTSYEVTLIAKNAGEPVLSESKTFKTAEVVPGTQTLYAGELTGAGATLAARVNPRNSAAVAYQFEWGTDTSYGNLVPPSAAPLGAEDNTYHPVSGQIDGLAPDSIYHFRIVATNTSSGETSFGIDRRMRTAAIPPASQSCPNDIFRIGLGAGLPDCRAYEQVSPPDKGPFTIETTYSTNRVLASGGAVQYIGTGAFPGTAVSLRNTAYLGERGPEGWTNRALSIPHKNGGFVTEFFNTGPLSEDGSHIVATSTLALTPEAVAGAYNVYLQDTASGELTFMYSNPNLPTFNVGGTPSFDHVVFVETKALTPDAIDNGNPKMYEFTDGELRLVSYVPTESGEAVSPDLVTLSGAELDDVISDDGSRIFFSLSSETAGPANGDLGLYMRVDGDHTVALSISQRPGDDDQVRSGTFNDASADGSVVYFQSQHPLTEQSFPIPPTPTDDRSLYRLEVDTNQLVDVAAELPGVDPQVRIANTVLATADGAGVFFVADSPLTTGGRDGSNLYYWSAAQLVPVAEGLGGSPGNTNLKFYALSPNGRYLGILDGASLTGYDGAADGCEGPCQQAFLYDVSEETLSCASCPGPGTPTPTHNVFGVENGGYPVSAVTDAGRLYFTTPSRLALGDSNGKKDVYEYFRGNRALLSSGSASQNALLIGASASGDDVFFTTNQQLVAQDRDQVDDLYDARVGGGLAGQGATSPSPPCEGEGCQPSGALPPPPSIGSASLNAAGQRSQRCNRPARNTRKEHRRGQARRSSATERQPASKKAPKSKRKAKRCQGGTR